MTKPIPSMVALYKETYKETPLVETSLVSFSISIEILAQRLPQRNETTRGSLGTLHGVLGEVIISQILDALAEAVARHSGLGQVDRLFCPGSLLLLNCSATIPKSVSALFEDSVLYKLKDLSQKTDPPQFEIISVSIS